MMGNELPVVFVGEEDLTKHDWRKSEVKEADTDDDDDAPASKHVVEMLGFDPDKENWD